MNVPLLYLMLGFRGDAVFPLLQTLYGISKQMTDKGLM